MNKNEIDAFNDVIDSSMDLITGVVSIKSLCKLLVTNPQNRDFTLEELSKCAEKIETIFTEYKNAVLVAIQETDKE